MKTAIILYKIEQIALLDALVEQWNKDGEVPGIVSLDAEIDYALEKRKILFVSGRMLQNRVAPDSYMKAGELARTMCESETLSFLQYRNIPLLRPLRLSLHQYLQTLLYYIEILTRFVDNTKDIRQIITLAPTTFVHSTSGALAEYEIFVVAEAVRQVAESRGIKFTIVQNTTVSSRVNNRFQKYSFVCKRELFGIALSLLNMILSLQSRHKIRILASDYWRNISPILKELPEAELILLDRSEALKAGFSNIWRHKIHFVHIDHFLSNSTRQKALLYAKDVLEKWQETQTYAWKKVDFIFFGVSLESLCKRIMMRIIERAVPRVVCSIEGAYAMYEQLLPDTILLRASVSGQIHFAILPLVARQMNITALEVQHGGDYFGPGSPTRDRSAYFFATYGPLVCEELRHLNYKEDRLLAVGSPRFDAYILDVQNVMVQKKHLDLTILTNTPSVNLGERFGTYSAEEYFKALGRAVSGIPGAHLNVASRSNSFRVGFMKEARVRGLQGVAYEYVGATPLPQLFKQTDIFICSHSTVVYEALLYRLPVIVASFAPVEKMMTDFHFSRFQDAGALLIAHTPEELNGMLKKLASDSDARRCMSIAGWKFMKQNFSFDGKASKRIAKFIRAHS